MCHRERGAFLDLSILQTARAEMTSSPANRDLFGHPKGLTVLFATEMWERFSYYGMASLLVLYLVKYLLLPGQVDAVIGYHAVKRGLESIFGPLGPQPLASHIYGFYAGFAYLTPILGGYLADRWLGQRKMVIIGALLMAAGHFLMSFESLLFVALGFLVLGMGAFKPNVSTQVGSLYALNDPRRVPAYSIYYLGIHIGALLMAGGPFLPSFKSLVFIALGFLVLGMGAFKPNVSTHVGSLYALNDPRRVPAYSIYYLGINIGAFLAPLIAGTLGGEVSWHYGFMEAGVGRSV